MANPTKPSENDYLESSLESATPVLDQLKLGIKWWESKRWIFNILVGITGVLVL